MPSSGARPIAVFRMTLLLVQPGGDERAGCRTDLLSPVNEPLWRPFEMGAVCGRHVFDDGGVAARAIVTGVAGLADALSKQLAQSIVQDFTALSSRFRPPPTLSVSSPHVQSARASTARLSNPGLPPRHKRDR